MKSSCSQHIHFLFDGMMFFILQNTQEHLQLLVASRVLTIIVKTQRTFVFSKGSFKTLKR